jgi:hypothetical protein
MFDHDESVQQKYGDEIKNIVDLISKIEQKQKDSTPAAATPAAATPAAATPAAATQ